MKPKEQVIFDLNSEKFKYLHRVDKTISKRVNIDELNARLNKNKKNNIYYNVKIIALCLACLTIISLISLRV